MSGYESPSPADEVVPGGVQGGGVDDELTPSETPDAGTDASTGSGGQTGSATGGGSPGNQDAMGADDGLTVAEGAGRPQAVEETGADGETSDPEAHQP